MLCETKQGSNTFGEMFVCSDMSTIETSGVKNEPYIDNPTNAPNVTNGGSSIIVGPGDNYVARMTFIYTYTNKFGSTLESANSTTVYTSINPFEFDSTHFLTISGSAPSTADGVDIYYTADESTSFIFCGHTSVENNS